MDAADPFPTSLSSLLEFLVLYLSSSHPDKNTCISHSSHLFFLDNYTSIRVNKNNNLNNSVKMPSWFSFSDTSSSSRPAIPERSSARGSHYTGRGSESRDTSSRYVYDDGPSAYEFSRMTSGKSSSRYTSPSQDRDYGSSFKSSGSWTKNDDRNYMESGSSRYTPSSSNSWKKNDDRDYMSSSRYTPSSPSREYSTSARYFPSSTRDPSPSAYEYSRQESSRGRRDESSRSARPALSRLDTSDAGLRHAGPNWSGRDPVADHYRCVGAPKFPEMSSYRAESPGPFGRHESYYDDYDNRVPKKRGWVPKRGTDYRDLWID